MTNLRLIIFLGGIAMANVVKYTVSCFLFILLFVNYSFAKPVKIEEIVTKTKKIQTDITINYSNINQNTNIQAPFLIELPDGSFSSIPSYLGSEKINKDIITYSLNMRYGIIKRLEIYSLLTGFSDFIRSTMETEISSNQESKFDILSAGISYQIFKEKDHPALLASLSTHIVDNENWGGKYARTHFKSYSCSMISYCTVDPVIFMLKFNYQLNLKKSHNTESINPGEVGTFSPQIYFAVNPYTTLNWGYKWTIQGKNSINNKIVSDTNTSTAYVFGLGYEIRNNLILSVDTEFKNTPDYTQSSISMNFNYKI